jgi:hypothetical protein
VGLAEEIAMKTPVIQAAILAGIGFVIFSILSYFSSYLTASPERTIPNLTQLDDLEVAVAILEGAVWFMCAVIPAVAGVITGVVGGMMLRKPISRRYVALSSGVWAIPFLIIFGRSTVPAIVGVAIFAFCLAGGLAFLGRIEARPAA